MPTKCLFSLVGQWALFTRFGPLLLSTRGWEIGTVDNLLDPGHFCLHLHVADLQHHLLTLHAAQAQGDEHHC